jgi:uncharacterized protein
VAPENAFWSLVRKEQLGEVFGGSRSELWARYQAQAEQFAAEMRQLRFGLQPSAVYFNPTERCNLNCTYCYIPETMRRDGEHMSQASLIDALGRLRDYFHRTLPAEATPQVVFHGAEPLLNRDALFAGIEAFRNDFRFGVQTNATRLDDEAIRFFQREQVSIGLSLDGATAETANRTRLNWQGQGQYDSVLAAMERLRGYDGWSVICTITGENISSLTELVEFLHAREVPTCLLNIVRCTLPTARQVKPDDTEAAPHFIAALERTYELYQETGRKLTVGNFANILLSIVAPTARRLMCDISPCGGGRCFFAVAPNGDLFPCSEFIGLPSFCGGNLFRGSIEEALASDAFRAVTGRQVEDIEPCRRCALRHFCGSPCPAEAHELHGAMDQPGAFCEFYEEQVRYAFRLIADRREEAFLWDGWSEGTTPTFRHIQQTTTERDAPPACSPL